MYVRKGGWDIARANVRRRGRGLIEGVFILTN